VSWRPPAPKPEPPPRKQETHARKQETHARKRPASSFQAPVLPKFGENRVHTRENLRTSEPEPEDGPESEAAQEVPAPQPKPPQPEVPPPGSSRLTRLRAAAAEVLRRLGPELGVFGIFLIAAAVITWPVVQHLATAVPGNLTDSLENSYIFSWDAHALLHQPLHLFDANIFYPERLTLAYSENVLGLAVFVAPLYWLTHNPILIVNVATIALYAVGGYTTYLLVRELGGSRGPGVVAGLAFMAAPYRVLVVQHLTVLATHLMPLAFLLLLRIEREVGAPTRRPGAAPSARWHLPRLGRLAIVLGLVVALAMWSSINGGFITLAGIAIWAVWEVAMRRGRAPRILVPSLAGVVLGLLLSLPVLIPYAMLHRIHPEFSHSLAEVLGYSASPGDYLVPPLITGGPGAHSVYGTMMQRFGTTSSQPYFVKTGLFPGLFLTLSYVVAAVAAAAALIRRRTRARARRWTRHFALFSLVALGGFVLTLGPTVGRTPSGFPLPYDVLYRFVPAGAIRVPVRFFILVLFGMAVAMGVVLAAARPTLRRVLVGLSLLALALDMVHAPFSIVHAPPITEVHRMAAHTTGGMLALPTMEWDASGVVMISSVFRETIQEYLSTGSFHRIVNGVGSLVPPFYIAEAAAVQDFPAPASMAAVRTWGVRSVMVETSLVAGTRWRGAAAKLDRWPGVRLLAGDSEARLYDISAAGPAPG
jgi:hypothetical protein